MVGTGNDVVVVGRSAGSLVKGIAEEAEVVVVCDAETVVTDSVYGCVAGAGGGVIVAAVVDASVGNVRLGATEGAGGGTAVGLSEVRVA